MTAAWTERIGMMQKQSSSEMPRSVLAPTTPVDIGARSQRRRIVEAMIDSCAEKTYATTTISDIVSRARISRTTFYKRFNDKRECFDAAVDASVEELQAAVYASYSPGGSPADTTREATAAVLRAMAARPELAQLLSGDAISVDPGVVDRYRRLLVPALERLWDRDGTPGSRHLDPVLAFGRAQILIFNRVATGEADRLPELLPDLVYLAVAPFAGHEEGIRQSQLATAEAISAGRTDGDGHA
jgi:AcrR family transcriptional regulator